jgi:CYTH domain-containing protein
MWPLTKGKRVRKRRYRLADAGQVWEIDEFLDRRLVLAEIELTSARDTVSIPDWLARCVVREVTGEPEYLNHTLAR